MNQSTESAPASAEQQASDTTDDNLSVEDMVAQYTEPETAEPEEGDEVEGEINGLNLEDLDEDQLENIAEQLNSRAAGRIAGLIRERKALQGELEASRVQKDEDPFKGKAEPETNPYKDIETIEDLQKKHDEVETMVEWAEDLLADASEEHRDVTIYEEDGKEYTKGEIRKLLRTARKGKSHLRTRHKELGHQQVVNGQRAALRQEVEKRFPWRGEEENVLRKEYEQTLARPEIAELIKTNPAIELILAHAADSMDQHQRQNQPKGRGKSQPGGVPPLGATKSPLVPPTNPPTGAASPAPTRKPAKALASLQAQYEDTGDPQVLADIYAMQDPQS